MNDLHSAFAADALASTHPLNPPEADIQSPTDINDLFDDITYSKVGDGDWPLYFGIAWHDSNRLIFKVAI